MSKRVTVLERSLRIMDLEIMRKDVAEFFPRNGRWGSAQASDIGTHGVCWRPTEA
jgi:hypothetical protein